MNATKRTSTMTEQLDAAHEAGRKDGFGLGYQACKRDAERQIARERALAEQTIATLHAEIASLRAAHFAALMAAPDSLVDELLAGAEHEIASCTGCDTCADLAEIAQEKAYYNE
jgi:hypothetical protein